MRLKTKIVIGFVCVSLLLAVVGFVSDHYTGEIRQAQLNTVNDASSVVMHTGELERSLYQSLIFLNGIREAYQIESTYSTVQELPSVVDLTEKFETELSSFEEAFTKLEVLINEKEQLPQDLTDLFKSYTVYRSIAREWLELGAENSDQANLMFITSIEPYFRNNIIPEISKTRRYALDVQEVRNQSLNQSLKEASLVNYIATALSVLFALVLAVYIYRSISGPLEKVSRSAKKLGEGNLDERINHRTKDEIGELAKAFNTMAESLQRSTVSKAYLDNIIESIQEALFVADSEGKLVRTNTAAAKLTGYSNEEMLNKPLTHLYNVSEMGTVYEQKRKSDHSFEFSLKHKNSRTIPVLFSEAELVDNSGTKVGSVAVASDITERKQAERRIRESLKEKEVMLAEIHHRVKNNLAVVSGLLQLQSFNAKNSDVQNALADSQLRIQSIALVHEMLYENESLAYIKYDKYISDLMEAISNMLLRDDRVIKIETKIDPLALSINQAIPFSLLITEIVVNAFKHAFSGKKEGKIVVEVKMEGDLVRMNITDDGQGVDIHEFNNSDSLGATLIKTLSSQLNAEFKILERVQDSGSVFQVTFERKG
ncbi:histidine kinase dimerization/phosphoacceptor domain -containing protein [Gracilimonas amylolytica]|uniref:histidine kinase dimerization/phosphoacceptor domain -containing protein n=1 Tax=Gracilimonas amylolytica TaxID=1749045 RepID=UPI000CD97F86|nr:histidine kinase dimerization/phosphoacceptor domain -containing protein [Gracilimonas amylolytica]